MLNSVDYFEFIDKYCERTTEGLWAEPLNVITNISFFVVSILIFRLYWETCRVNGRGSFLKNWDISLLILLLFSITLGSTLWHLLAVRWALFADVIPILLFISLFLFSCFIRILRLSVIPAILLFCLYQLFNYVTQQLFSMDTLNGSIFYLPVYIFLTGILIYACRKKDGLCHYYLLSLGLFTIALFLRTLDQSQCEAFPIGTHFLWHTLIAAMLYFLTKSLILSQAFSNNQANKELNTKVNKSDSFH